MVLVRDRGAVGDYNPTASLCEEGVSDGTDLLESLERC